jgi:hypothetical protein
MAMLRPMLTAMLAALSLGAPAYSSEWTERYFGVGSGGDRGEACGLARDHAQGNSFRACIDRRGKRGDAAYTDCICTSAGESMQVCNVNLKVACDGSLAGGDSKSPQQEGGLKGRAGRRRDGSPRRVVRPGPDVRPAH